MLSKLPPELIAQIISYLGKADLKQIRLVSKQLEALATPLLFAEINIFVNEHGLVGIPIERALASSFKGDRNLLHLARRITFTSQFRIKHWRRCPHFHRRTRFERESTSYSESDVSDEGDEGDPEEDDPEEGDPEKGDPEENRAEQDELEETEPDNDEPNEPDEDQGKEESEEPKDESDGSVETRYPDDDLLDGHNLTESEQRDVNRYIPWEYDCENPAAITQMKNRVMAMLIRCKEGSLLEFNWELGVCCPYAVLGYNGILPRKQQNIESIRIVNDSQCHGHEYWLANFPRLKRLSWIPLTWRDDMDALGMGLEKFSRQLTLLELDMYAYESKGREGYRPYYFKFEPHRAKPNWFAWEILDLDMDGTKQVFPSLQRLYLCGIPFEFAEMEMAHAFDWSRLQSLHLRFCFGWAEFLRQVIKTGQQINLTSLTLEPSPLLESQGTEVETISLFLRAFTGLRDLFLSTNETFGALDIWKAVLNHRATLRRFVHNQRLPAADDDGHEHLLQLHQPTQFIRGQPWALDPPELPFTPQEMEMLAETPAANPLASLDLEFLGLSIPPAKLKTFVSAFTNKQTLQLLHVRQTGAWGYQYHRWGADARSHGHATPDLIQFGDWALGPDGISSLRGLAAGDFAYGNRLPRSRYMTTVRFTWPPLDVKFADALGACPQEDLCWENTDPNPPIAY